MLEFDFYVCGNEAVLDLNYEQLALDSIIHIHNSGTNPINKLFLNLPHYLTTSALTNLHSLIDLDGPATDLIITINSDTHIHKGNFTGFLNILITDHKILQKNNTEVILDNNQTYNAKLIINNLMAKGVYIFCNNLNLLGKGRITEILGIKLHGNDQKLTMQGDMFPNFLVVSKLDIHSDIHSLSFDKILIQENFSHKKISKLNIKATIIKGDWNIDEIGNIESLSLQAQNNVTKLSAESVEVNSLNYPRGKFYIAAKSYINFKIESQGKLSGIDLVLDMSSANNAEERKIVFPACKFYFDRVKIINASYVSIPYPGSCREITFDECYNVKVIKLEADRVTFAKSNGVASLSYSGKILTDLFLNGEITVRIENLTVKNIEAYGLCNLNLSAAVKCEAIKLNLNLDASNPSNAIKSGNSVIRIDNNGNQSVEIGLILAKLSTFYVKGNAKLGTVLIQSIENLDTMLWVDIGYNTRLVLERLFVGYDHDLIVSKNGTITVVKNDINRKLIAGQTFVSVSASAQEYFYIKAGNGIRFNGKLEIIGDGGLFSKYGDVFVSGHIRAGNNLAIISEEGRINIASAHLQARAMTFYSNSETHLLQSLVEAESVLIYSLNNCIQIDASKLNSCKITVVAAENVSTSNSHLQANQLVLNSGRNISIQHSELIAYDIFIKAINNFFLAKSQIDLAQYSYTLFAEKFSANEEGLFKGGLKIAKDITLIGMIKPRTDKTDLFVDIQWQKINFEHANNSTENGKAYIDAKHGYIIGSNISAENSEVIIKTTHSLEIVPLSLYNEVVSEDGITTSAVKELVSKINAGTIKIEAGKVVVLVGSLLKAATGSVSADIIYLLRSPAEIKAAQGRIKILEDFGMNLPGVEIERMNVGRYFNFTNATSITQRIGNLGIYDNYVSNNLSFTLLDGDIILDKSWHNKYEKLHLNAQQGKILIVSKWLLNVYQGAGGGEGGRTAAYENRVVIGGDNIYLAADQIVMQGSKFAAKGDLKIVTRDGVYILPVAVHERLMHYHGSKTKIEEFVVRQVISEIKAGFLEIKAGGVLEVVNALIQATGIKLDVKKLNLRAEYDVFEKHIHFTGQEKWYGKQNLRQDYIQDKLVLPTFIGADNLYAKISGDTTIEAAQILVREESVMQAGGNISILPKYDIHLHDHIITKSYLFKFNGGKLTINGSKTVKEHFYGESPTPTIYYSGGSFFAYSEGKIHLLGAKIIANDIYLIGQQGVRIEAAAYTEDQVISFNEVGARIGYNVNKGQPSVSAELFRDIDKLRRTKLLYEAAEIIAKSRLVIESKDGELEVISSKLKFTKSEIKVRGLKIHTHQEVITTDSSHTGMSAGIHAGMQESISSSVKRASDLINKRGTHWLDILDRGLNGYQFYHELGQIREDLKTLIAGPEAGQAGNLLNLKSVKFGVWAQGKVSTQGVINQLIRSVDNKIIGGDINIQVDGDAIIEGIVCEVDNFRIKANSLSVTASSDHSTQENYSSEVTIVIPIKGNVQAGAVIRANEGSASHHRYHDNNIIIAKGKLEIDVAEDGRVSGVKLRGAEILIRARNLVVESLQDTLQERMQGMELSIGAGRGNINSLGAKGQVTSRDAAWTKAIGSIVGTQVVNVVVQQTLEIAGGLISNAEIDEAGRFTDKGKLKVAAGSIIARTLHDYDNGSSFGLGIALNRKVDVRGNNSWGVGMPVICAFNNSDRDILPTIGAGEVTIGDEITGTGLEHINRNIDDHITSTNRARGSLDANVPVSDVVEFVQERLLSNQPEIQGISSGDEPTRPIDSVIDWVRSLFLDASDQQMEQLEQENIAKEVGIDEATTGILLIKSNELGFDVKDLQNDLALARTIDVTHLDLSITYWQELANQQDGVTKAFAEHMKGSLQEVREDIINGNKSFAAYWQETKENLNNNRTSWGGAVPDGAGNLINYVEGKVGNVLSNNVPKIKASFNATLGTVFAYGCEAAIDVFGQDNVQALATKLSQGKAWLDEHSTEGQQKLVAYLGAAAVAKLGNKFFNGLKIKNASTIVELPSEFFDAVPKYSVFKNPANLKILTPLHKQGVTYFESGISKLEEAIHHKLKLQDLPANVQKDFGALAKVNRAGVVESIHHMQDHHILPKAIPKFQEIFAKAGTNVDDMINSMHLPDGVGKDLFPTNRSIHLGKNTDSYYEKALKNVVEALEIGADDNWSPARYKSEVIKIITPMRSGLTDGTIKLNGAKTIMEKIKNGTN